MSILGTAKKKKEKKPPFLFMKRLSERIPKKPGHGEKKLPEKYAFMLEEARREGLKHRVPRKVAEEFLKSVERIDKGESLEKVISRLQQKGINDPRMFRILAERAEKRAREKA